MHYLYTEQFFKKSFNSINDLLENELFKSNDNLFFFDEFSQENNSLELNEDNYNTLYFFKKQLKNENVLEKQDPSNLKNVNNSRKENILEKSKENSKSTGENSNNKTINKTEGKKGKNIRNKKVEKNAWTKMKKYNLWSR